MKVLKEDNDHYIIYLLNIGDQYDEEDKQMIIKLVKDTVLRVNRVYRLNLKGFYKVRVYSNKKLGLVIEIINVDDFNLSNALDLRVLVYFDQEFYIEVDNFDFLPSQKRIIYVNDKFYIDVNSLTESEIISLLEFGNLIYRPDVIDNFNLGKIIMN